MNDFDITEALIGLAEIAMATAGFSGFVIALHGNNRLYNQRLVFDLILGVFVHTLGAVFFALLALNLLNALGPQTAWHVTTMLHLGIGAILGLLVLAGGGLAALHKLPLWLNLYHLLLLCSQLGFLVLNLLFEEPQSWPVLAALSINILVAISFFIYLVISLIKVEDA